MIKKRLLSFIVAFAMISTLCLGSVPVFAEELSYNIGYTYENLDSVVAVYNTDTKTLTISGSQKMDGTLEPWSEYKAEIESIIFEGDGDFSEIDRWTFREYSNLKSIVLPTNITQSPTFDDCMLLESVEFGDNDILTTLGSFTSCANLKSITIPKSVTSIGGFPYCSSLETVIFEDGINISSIENYTFADCSSLKSIDIPNGVKVIGDYAFYNCYSMTTVTIPEGVTSIGESAFNMCAEIKTITIPSSVETIGDNAFDSAYFIDNFISNSEKLVYNDNMFGSEYSYMGAYTSNKIATVPANQTELADKLTILGYNVRKIGTDVGGSGSGGGSTDGDNSDEIETSGLLENDIAWEHDTEVKVLTFDTTTATSTTLPEFEAGTQPYAASFVENEPATTIDFGGVTDIGSSAFLGLNYDEEDEITIYGDNAEGFEDAILEQTGVKSVSYGGSELPEGASTVIVNQAATNFVVTVPFAISVNMDAEANITVSEGLTIDNKCAWGPIIVKTIQVITRTDWSLGNYDTEDFINMPVSTKKIGMTINDSRVNTDGSVVLNDSLSSTIKHNDSKTLFFDAKLPAQKTAIEETVAAIIFTIDWDKV